MLTQVHFLNLGCVFELLGIMAIFSKSAFLECSGVAVYTEESAVPINNLEGLLVFVE